MKTAGATYSLGQHRYDGAFWVAFDDMIDITFDVYSDTPAGKDPDLWSPTLRAYHRQLWSKPLVCGQVFELSTQERGVYLHHRSALGEFTLSSDSIVNSYRNARRMTEVIAKVPAEVVHRLFSAASTIGAYTVFPSQTVDRRPTINGARGMHPRIGDRFDLTLECIRLYYEGLESPLSAALSRYVDFFALFGDFKEYVNFFMLQDLVDPSAGAIKFFLPCAGFARSPYPSSPEEYLRYADAAIAFIDARNRRISQY